MICRLCRGSGRTLAVALVVAKGELTTLHGYCPDCWGDGQIHADPGEDGEPVDVDELYIDIGG